MNDSAFRIPHSAFVALGSNLGDSAAIVRSGMDRLQAYSDSPIRRSSLLQTAPVDCPPGSPDFVNAVVALQPRAGETPESLLEKLLQLEPEFGPRPRVVVNAPRHLDLDLIAFGEETRDSADLILPHPRATQRRFVLQPLAEIAPDLILPGETRSASDLLQQLNEQEDARS